MGPRLVALPFVVLVLATLDAVAVRVGQPYRATEPGLFLEALGIWLVFAALALLPATLLHRYVGPRRRLPGQRARAVEEGITLLGWTALPVLAHAVLDRHSSIGGSLAGLLGVRPWLEVLGALLAALLLLAGADRLLSPRRGWQVGAGLLLLLPVGLFLPWRGRPHADVAAAAPTGRPNLLLLVWDTTRSDRLLPYGAGRPTTPNLERLAEESVLFESSRSVSVFTFSSHLSLLTGELPSDHGGRLLSTRYDPSRAASVATLLREAGYRTGAFVGTDVLSGRTGIGHDFEVWDDQVDPRVCDTYAWKLVHDLQAVGAAVLPPLRHDGRPHWIQDFQRPASEVLARAERWIRADDPRPWFCLINLYDVHWPYLPSEESRRELVRPYSGPMDGFLFRSDAWQPGYRPDEEDERHMLDLYDAELRDLDREVDAFLGRAGLLDGGTAIVMTSDHGEAFGEGGVWKHDDVFEPQVRVPLLVRPAGPAVAGRREPGPTSGVDVAPTLLGLAGVPAPEGWARSGLDVLAAPPAAERPIWVQDRDQMRPENMSIVLYLEPFKLVRRGLGEEATYGLYDLVTDPIGEVDVSAEHPEVFARMRSLLAEARLEADRRDAVLPEGVDGQADALKALGYVGEE